MRRWLRRLLVVLAVLVLLAVGGAVAFERFVLPHDDLDVVEAGALTVASGVAGEWEVDGLTVTLSAAEGLSIREGERVVWASDRGAFVTGARGSVAWDERRGYFWPTVTIEDRLGDQSVTGVTPTDEQVEITGRLSGIGNGAPYTVTVRPREAGGATIDVVTDGGLYAVGLVSGRSEGAGVHGFGAQTAGWDLDGRLLPIVVREQGVGRGQQPLTFLADVTNGGAGGTEDMTYGAWSSFVTDDLRGLGLDPDEETSHAFAVADLRNPGRVVLEVWSNRLRAEVTSALDPAGLVAAQQGGPAAPLAEWPLDGAIVGLQGGTTEVREHLDTLLAADADISAVWIQDWTGRRITSFGDRLWWTWQRDDAWYPGWRGLVRDLAEQDIQVTTYVNPFLVDASLRPGGDDGIRNLWQEAADEGFLVRRSGDGTYELDQGGFEASLVDLTNARARSWFADVIADEVLTDGVSGFMADFGEGLPYDAELDDGLPAYAHNRWPALWARTVALACRRAELPDCVTWMRSGALGQARDVPLFWAGDQLVDWSEQDGLPSALHAMLSAGVSGWPLVHSDVGGYTSVDAVVRDYTRSEELLERWAELEALGVVMRTHEGNRPDDNVQVYDTPETAAAFASMTRLHAALGEYRRDVVARAAATGVPALRHVWFAGPQASAADQDDIFMLGDALLVAPVLSAGEDKVELTFPSGTWTHVWTGREYTAGETAEVEAPLGRPAAFVLADHPWTDNLLDAFTFLDTGR